VSPLSLRLPVRRVSGLVGRDHRLVTVTDGEQLVLAHDVLAAIFHVVLVDTGLDDRIHRARFLAKAAIDALEEIDVVARGTACAIGRHIRIDRDRERRADCFTKLAGDAALFAVRIATQRMQATEPRRLGRLLFRIVDRDLLAKQRAGRDRQAREQFGEQEGLD
jgi:hypothetical protein